MTSTTLTQPTAQVDPEQVARLDGFVERAQAAAQELRRLDQERAFRS